jgi:hypothetical protein
VTVPENVTPPDELERLRKARANPASGGPYRDAAGREFGDAHEFLRAQLRVDVVRAVKLGRAHDLLLRDGGRVKIGGAADMLESKKLRAALAECGVVIERHTGEQVDQIARAVLDIVEILDPHGEEDTTRAWIAEWSRNGNAVLGPLDVKDGKALKEATYGEGVPALFRGDDGRLYLKLDPFVSYVTKTLGRTTREDLATRLRRLGFEEHRIDERLPGGGKVRARTWRSPVGFDPLEDG